MPSNAIRIRVTPREPGSGNDNDPRSAFWAVVNQQQESKPTIASSEAKLCREFGRNLRDELLRELSKPLRVVDSELYPSSFRDFERMFLWDGPSSNRDKYRYEMFEAFSRLVEQRQQLLRESPSLRSVQERLSAAAGITFATRIAGYASLNLDLSVGSFKQLAKAFESDFDSFRVFLEAFVPVAFAEVFDEETADRLDFAVTIPVGAESAFRAAVVETSSTPSLASALPATAASPAAARERAEWLWRLANGSLLIPVLLALVVLYQGVKMLNETRATQYEALKPILEHQLKLLEEDRHRLLRDTAAPSQSPAATPTTPGPQH
jgi:hypothetical protein